MEEEVAKFIPCLILSCLKYTETHHYFKEELLKLSGSSNFDPISDSVMHFYIAFDAEYRRIIEKVFEDPSFMKSKSRFLSKIGSRCLKMSDNPTFFNFLLMCAFIGRVLSFCYTNGKCYRVAESACKCAVAIFQRKFLEFFNQEDGLIGLFSYSYGLNLTVLHLQDIYDDLKDILCDDLGNKQTVLRLLDNCIDVDSSQYFLTDFERNILYRATGRRLRKLKPKLDFLIHRIPEKYFSQNVMRNAFGSNLSDIASNRSTEYSLRGYNPTLPSSSVSCRTDSCSSPIDYTMKRDSESLNCNITENQSELSSCHTIKKLSELTNYLTVEKPSEQLNCSIAGNKFDLLDGYISEKRYEPSSSCVIERTPELSNCCITEMEIEPLNYSITKNDSELSSKETRSEGSLSLVYHETSREMHPDNYEPSNKQLTRSPQMSKRSFSVRSRNSEFPNKGDRIGSPENRQNGTSSETDAASVLKRLKTSNSPENKLALETDFTSSQKQLYPHSLNYSERTIHMAPSVSTFEDELPNTKSCLFEMETELPKKYPSKCPIPSGEDYNIQNHPSTSSSNRNSLPLELQTKPIFPSISNCLIPPGENNAIQNIPSTRSSDRNYLPLELQPEAIFPSTSIIPSISKCLIPSVEDYSIQNHPSRSSSDRNSLPLELQTEAISPSTSIDFSQKSITNISHPLQEQNLEVQHDKTSLKTQAAMALVSYGFDDHKKERNKISTSLLSSESSSSASTPHSFSEGYYASESDFSGSNEDEEFQYLPPFHSFQVSSLDISPSESEYYMADWEDDVTLTSLMSHQCFHCKTRCFNYVVHVFQEFNNHFID